IKEQSSENLKKIKQVRCEFSIEKGPRYRIDKIKIVGATEGRDKKLLQEIKSWRTTEARGGWLLIINRQSGLEAIQNWYASQGYLEAKADIEIEVRRFEKRINIKLLIEEGRLSQVAEIIIEGNEFFSSQELKKILLLKPGQLYNPDLVLKERNRLLAFYRSHGFREAVVTSRIEAKDEGPDVRINFQIKEGLLHKVSQVDFINLKESRKKKLAEIFNLKPGETFSSEKIFEGQKALYDTGDFSLVQVTIEPLPERPGEEKVKVELSPEPALSVGYGLRYNNKEKTEFTAGADFRHFFGFGRHGLVHYLQNARERDFRFSFLDRNFFGLKIESLLSFYLTRRKESGFISEEVGSSWRYQIALPGEVFMSTVIRRSRIHTYEINPVGPWPFDITLSLTELSIQTVRDTRDDSIDPHRGSFFSSSLTYSPKKLKSELTYLSWFGQASFYQPLSSNLIWASNFRLGLATAFDQVMIPSRRFYAGGSYSIRGFKQDMVGPYDPYLKRPEGGEAVLVTNQELRWSIVGGLEVAFFYDVGNVFPEVSDLNLKKLRHGAGFGLRFRSPLGLLRFDVGFNLKPRPGESRHVFFFSLGPIF
ncbi:MAG: BamA/TamA family outer membrane protein, partial [Candidatus Aminicenantes bacterium]|nr:BamA/TamA family outer membrane protein [Candidatus Aminicenantes bacterium]